VVHFRPLKVAHFHPLSYAHFNPLLVVHFIRFLQYDYYNVTVFDLLLSDVVLTDDLKANKDDLPF
jgi:hypothetical protein